MDDFQDEVDDAVDAAGWTLRRIFPLFLITVVVLAVIGFALHAFGVIGEVAVEREAFEQSDQRHSAIEQQIATDEATLAEIERQLENPELSPTTRHNLEAQRAATRIRFDAARRRQR